MRAMPKKQINCRGKILGGEKPLLCVPLVGKTEQEIFDEAKNVVGTVADVVELRIDAWDCVENAEASLVRLTKIRGMVDRPIILTCRGHWEGGIKEVSEAAKDRIYDGAIEKRVVEFIDKELCYSPEKLSALKKKANENGISLIISCHDFNKTPSKEFIYSQLAAQIRLGADVAKAAFMPQCEEDVLNLLSATLAVRRDFSDVPLITMSMGKLGAVSRIVGGLFGSDLTFGVGSVASAPGQLPVAELASMINILK